VSVNVEENGNSKSKYEQLLDCLKHGKTAKQCFGGGGHR